MTYLNERLQELTTRLDEYTDYPHHPASYGWFRTFQEYHVLPFAGAWLDQPQWWLDDVTYFHLLDERANLPHMITRAYKALKDAQQSMLKAIRA